MAVNEYKTVEGLTQNGCTQEDAQGIAEIIQIIDECFERHNREARLKRVAQNGKEL